MCKPDSRLLSVRVARLYADHVEYCQWLQLLSKQCHFSPGFPTECCDAHRHLERMQSELLLRAESVQMGTNLYEVLSSLWWEEQGYHLPPYAEFTD